ncbi:hypothetical protein BKA70DRAFT_1298738 [Coprinopsis sp. MPI-PUGE-AT-0042]|nr:hypothetical protein BKA70DRAFT_1306055 [Coprinopsis sp. MPI-PUGE-AT-0042]KAH6903883.1 hypothetical protein BKA70DRAFT_1298738 [Coprinopsis sp. MPI-PUGE-AT-0042]
MASQLPTELFREIVGHLSKELHIGTLQAGALAFSQLLVPCQEKIFSRISVSKIYKDASNQAHHLAGLELFRRNGNLLAYVKEVSIQQSEGSAYYNLSNSGPMDSSMVELIHLLATPSIERFSFSGWLADSNPGPEFQQGIIALVRSPRLTCLELRHAPEGLVSLVESPVIERLSLLRLEAYQVWPSIRLFSQHTSRRMQPTSLYITPDNNMMAFLANSNAVDLGSVEDLRLGYQTCRSWLSLMTRVPSLRRLCIDVDAIEPENLGGPGVKLSVTLSQLSQLEELEFDGIMDLGPHGSNQFSHLPLFLSALPSPSSLSVVKLASIFQDPEDFARGTDFWDGPDSILSSSTQFPKLEILVFETWFSDYRHRPTLDVYEEIQERYWPAVRRAGVLVDISDITLDPIPDG